MADGAALEGPAAVRGAERTEPPCALDRLFQQEQVHEGASR